MVGANRQQMFSVTHPFRAGVANPRRDSSLSRDGCVKAWGLLDPESGDRPVAN